MAGIFNFIRQSGSETCVSIYAALTLALGPLNMQRPSLLPSKLAMKWPPLRPVSSSRAGLMEFLVLVLIAVEIVLALVRS